jgi:ATP-dependent RNA helicase SUPV3L1/SUV3
LPDLSAGVRARVERRLLAHTRDLVLGLLAPLELAGELSAPLRGLLYQLTQGLGTVSRREVGKLLSELTPAERAQLASREIHVAHDSVFARAMLGTRELSLRRALTRLVDPALDQIKSALEETALATGLPRVARESALRLGFVPLASYLIRCDVLERLRAAQRESNDAGELLARVQLVLGDREMAQQLVRVLSGPGKRRTRKRRAHAR